MYAHQILMDEVREYAGSSFYSRQAGEQNDLIKFHRTVICFVNGTADAKCFLRNAHVWPLHHVINH